MQSFLVCIFDKTFSPDWILTAGLVAGHEVGQTLGAAYDGGGEQLGGEAPRVLLKM